MDAKLTAVPWVACVRAPHVGVDGAHHCRIGLSLYDCKVEGVTTLGYRCTPAAPENEYLYMSGICRPADAAAMAAAGEMLAALRELVARFESHIRSEYEGTSMLDGFLGEADHARAAIIKATTVPAVSTAPNAADGAA